MRAGSGATAEKEPAPSLDLRVGVGEARHRVGAVLHLDGRRQDPRLEGAVAREADRRVRHEASLRVGSIDLIRAELIYLTRGQLLNLAGQISQA